MHFTQVTSDHRLKAWRELRKNLRDSNVQAVVENFSIVPEKIRYIDYYTPKSWPSPFQVVSDGMFCQSGITLVLAATLIDLGFVNTPTLHFDVISSQIDSVEGLVFKHNEHYYNFIPGHISTVEEVRNNGTVFDTHIIAVDKLFD